MQVQVDVTSADDILSRANFLKLYFPLNKKVHLGNKLVCVCACVCVYVCVCACVCVCVCVYVCGGGGGGGGGVSRGLAVVDITYIFVMKYDVIPIYRYKKTSYTNMVSFKNVI